MSVVTGVKIKGGDLMVLYGCKRIREEKGLTLQEVAHKADCSVATIQNTERLRGVYRNTGKRIAAALGVKLEKLIEKEAV